MLMSSADAGEHSSRKLLMELMTSKKLLVGNRLAEYKIRPASDNRLLQIIVMFYPLSMSSGLKIERL